MYYSCLHTINIEVINVGKLPPWWKSELSSVFFYVLSVTIGYI